MRSALICLLLLAHLAAADRTLATAGDPDLGFAGDGTASHPHTGAENEHLDSVSLAPDGKIVLGGLQQPTGMASYAIIARLRADGSLDSDFGSGGLTTVGGATSSIEDVAVQPDGKTVAVGTQDGDAVIYRVLEGGGPDPAFGGGDGTVTLDSGGNEFANSVAIAPDGRIVAGGSTSVGGGDAAVWRVTSEGAPDLTFDTDGVAGLNAGAFDSVSAVGLTAGGQILALNRAGSGVTLWRLKPDGGPGALDGALDPGFAGDGSAQLDAGGLGEDLSVAPNGSVVVAGTASGAFAALWRVKADGGDGTPTGSLDPGFGTQGRVTIGPSPGGGLSGSGAVGAVEHAAQGKLVAVVIPNTVFSVRALHQLTATGTADTGFSGDGTVELTASETGLALMGDRRIVVAQGYYDAVVASRFFGDPFAVSVTKVGAGSGTVSSAPAGIDCGAACSLLLDAGSQATLVAAPATGSTFAGWSGGGCGGTGACTVTVPDDKVVEARFDPMLTASPSPSPSPSPEPGPAFSLDGLPKSIKLTKKGRGTLAITTRVSGAFKLTARVGKRRRTLATGIFATNGRIRFKVAKKLRGKRKRLKATLTVTADGVTARRAIVLKLRR